MQRIAIIGSAGTVKSTLARRLGELTGLDVIHLDALYWLTGWVATPDEEWEALVKEIASQERWITDGNYGRTMEPRLRASRHRSVSRFSAVRIPVASVQKMAAIPRQVQAGHGARLP